MDDKSDDKKSKISNCNVKNEGKPDIDPVAPAQPIASVSEFVKKYFNKLYTGGSSSSPNDKRTDSLPNNLTELLNAAEKRIKEFYEAVSVKISHFLDKDIRQLKDLSKDELTKINVALLDYKMQVEKITQEKISRIADIKIQLQKKFITAEEVQSFVKYIDQRITEIKKITENIISTLKKNDAANNLAKDLQSVITDYSKRIINAMDSLYNAMKETAGDLSRSVPDKETIMTKMPKIPTPSELQKMPSMMSNVFKKIGSSGTKHFVKTGDKPLIPISMREKLTKFNISKHFNSETMYGRANVAKATYATALLTFLYWKFRHSRS